jgi:hypothetical protein
LLLHFHAPQEASLPSYVAGELPVVVIVTFEIVIFCLLST